MNKDKTLALIIKLKDEASKKAKSIGAAFKGMMSAIKTAAKVAVVIAGIGIAIAAMAAKGDQIIALRSSFQTLAAGVGENADEMLTAMRTATTGLVSDAELITKANNAILLGLPVTTESMAEMSEAAVVLGRAMGLDATKALESVIVGLGRQSKLWLDNLGIMVDVEAGNKKYAESINKTASELDDVERKQAFFNAAMDQMRDKVDELGPVVLGFGAKIAVAKIAVVNFKDELFAFTSAMGVQVLNAFVDVTGGADDFSEAIKFNTKVAVNFVKTALAGMIRGFAILQTTGGAVLEIYLRMALAVMSAYDAFTTAIGATNKEWMVSEQTLAGMREGLAGLEADTQASVDAAEQLALNIEAIDIGDVQRGMAGVGRETGKAADEAARLKKEQEAAAAAIAEAATAAKAQEEAIKAAAEAAKAASKDIADAFLIEFEGGIPALDREEMMLAANSFANMLGEELPDLGLMSTEDVQRIAEMLGASFQEIEDAAERASRTFSKNVEGLVGAAVSGDAKAIASSVGDMFEGVDVFGFDIGAIINAVTSISKELPSLLFQSIKDLLINVIADLPLLVGNIIPDLVIPILELVPVILQRFVENLPIMINAIILALPFLVMAIILMIPNIIKIIPSLLTSILTTWFPNWWKGQKPVLIQTLAEAALETIEFFRNGIPDIVSDLGTEISAWYKGFFQGLSDDFATLFSDLAAQFTAAILESWQGFSDNITLVWDNTFGLLPKIAEDAGDALAGPLGDIVDAFNSAVDRIPEIPGGGGDGGLTVAGVKLFHAGTPFVPQTGLAMLQRGERVTSTAENAMGGAGVGGGGVTINVYPSAGMDENALAEKVSKIVKQNTREVASTMRRSVMGQSN